jgi:hypothetical protein
MVDFKRYIPSLDNEPFYAQTKYGLRKVQYDSKSFHCYRYIDCIHPAQQANCNPYEIEGWEYIDKQKMDELHIKEGWIYKELLREEGESILSKVKPNRIKQFIYNLRVKLADIIKP